jgi:DNA-binding FadR family transcriptional regulator
VTALRPRKKTAIAGQFVAHPRQLLASTAMRVLTLSERRALDRIELKHMDHGGAENGKLPVTYADFEKWGVRRDSIAGAIRALEALGLIEITRHGYAGAVEKRAPSLYRLTYLGAWNAGRADATGTHEYQKIKTVEEAELVVVKARKATEPRNVDRGKMQNATPQIVGRNKKSPTHK